MVFPTDNATFCVSISEQMKLNEKKLLTVLRGMGLGPRKKQKFEGNNCKRSVIAIHCEILELDHLLTISIPLKAIKLPKLVTITSERSKKLN